MYRQRYGDGRRRWKSQSKRTRAAPRAIAYGVRSSGNLPDGYTGAYLPEGVQVSDRSSLLGRTQKTGFPPPYTRVTQADCTKHIADGTIVILVNIAVNKGHNIGGQCTLTMKNHFGTFTPTPSGHGNLEYALSINKSNAILGGSPVRQQLCIIDSLWGMTYGPNGVPNKNTYRLIMGTFGPAVDYLTVKKIREPIMGADHTDNDVARFLTEFGYNENEAGDLVSVSAASLGILKYSSGRRRTTRMISVTVDGYGINIRSTRIRLPVEEKIHGIDIVDVLGRTVRSLKPASQSTQSDIRLSWDGKNENGRSVATGTYIVSVSGEARKYYGSVLLRNAKK